jgi:opacity protein-like surface antigen
MKTLKFASLAAIAVISAMSTFAHAAPMAPASKISGEIGYTETQLNAIGYKANPGVIRAVVAYDLTENLAVEGMAGLSASSANTTFNAAPISIKVDNMYGVYLKPKAKIAPDLTVFGRVGWAASTTIISDASGSLSEKNDALSYGLGINYNISKTMHVGMDYMSYLEKSGVTGRGLTASVGFKF